MDLKIQEKVAEVIIELREVCWLLSRAARQLALLDRVVFREVGGVASFAEVGNNRRSDLLLLKILPIHTEEPSMIFHILSAISQVSKTFAAIRGQQTADQMA